MKLRLYLTVNCKGIWSQSSVCAIHFLGTCRGAANLKLTVSILSLEDVILLGCDTMLLDECFLTFGGHFHPLKFHELLAQQNRVTSRNIVHP